MLTVFLLFSSCSSGRRSDLQKSDHQSDAQVTVFVARPQRRSVTEQLSLAGAVAPDEEVTLYAKVGGYLKSIRVDIGDRVRRGQFLAEVEVPEMLTALNERQAALLKAEADLAKARADVNQAEAEVGFQKINYGRLKAIHDREPDILPENDVDQARAAHAVSEGKLQATQAQVKVAEATLEAARAEIQTLKVLMGYARITAPVDGVISERFVDSGDLIQTALSSRTQAAPVVSVARVDRVRVVIHVPEPKAGFVHPGMPAQIQVRTSSNQPILAKVSRVGTVLDPGTRSMRVELDVSNPKGELRPGMTANVSLELRRLDNTLTVPVSALRTEGDSATVFVVQEERARSRRVKTGLESPEWIQVAEGLSGQEEVVVVAASNLSDNQKVRVQR